MRNYKQLSQAQRYQIEILKKAGKNQKEIAELLGVSAATISRELMRNKGQKGYRPKQVRIPVKVATQSTGMLPPKPVKAATPSERSDAGGLFLLYLVSCRQICLLFSE